jgi:hypothetical protein
MYFAVTILAIAHAFALPNTPCYTSISVTIADIPLITLHELAFYSTTSDNSLPTIVASSSLLAPSTDQHLLNTTSCTPGAAECHFMMDKFRWCNAQGFWVGNYCGGEQVYCDKGAWGLECTTRGGYGVPTDGRSKRGDGGGVKGRGADEGDEEGEAWW